LKTKSSPPITLFQSFPPLSLSLNKKRVNGKELLTTILVADDLNARILVAAGSPIHIGWDGTMLFRIGVLLPLPVVC
jgi:hypothetical protein